MFSSLPYRNRRAPFADFVVVHGPAKDRITRLLDLSCDQIGETAVYQNVTQDSLRAGFFIGMIRHGKDLLLGPQAFDENARLKQIITERPGGQYIVVMRNEEGGVSIQADPFGMIPIFHARIDDSFFVASQLHLLALAIRAAGKRAELHVPAVAATWLLDNSIGMQQMTRTSILSEAVLSDPGDRIVTSSSGVRIDVADRQLSPLRSVDEYQDYIRAGAEDIRQNILAAVNSGRRVVSTLTGGRDSRVMLAAIVSLGLEREIEFQTNDTDEDDTRIATGLVSHFKGRFNVPRKPFGLQPLSPEETLNHHRSSFFGTYHAFKKKPFERQSGERTIALIGGCGELYRAFYGNAYPNELIEKDFSEKALANLFATNTAPFKLFPRKMFNDDVFPSLYETFAALPGVTVEQRLDAHYMFYRNRLHFGTAATAPHFSVFKYHPLISPTLLELVHRVPKNVRRSGRILYDVTRHLSAEVAHFPYAKSDPRKFADVEFHTPGRYEGEILPLEPNRALLKEADTARKQMIIDRQRPQPAHKYNDKAVEYFVDFLKQHDRIGTFITPQFEQRLEWLRENRGKFHRVWISRLAAAHDVLKLNDDGNP